MDIKIKERPAKVLHFDIENMPLAYSGGDYTTAEVTAIAASWAHQKTVKVWLLGRECMHCGKLPTGTVPMQQMLEEFLVLYNSADIVTGHFIRAHDLPMLNSALIESYMPPLSPKWTSDTYFDLVKRKSLSASQESLSGMYRLAHPKHHMSSPEWREANRLTGTGVKLARKRAVADVNQHKELRAKMIEMGVLKRNKEWKP